MRQANKEHAKYNYGEILFPAKKADALAYPTMSLHLAPPPALGLGRVTRLVVLCFFLLGAPLAFGHARLLNVSFDLSREFYRDVNALFSRDWQEAHGEKIEVRQSHGPASAQARAVLHGLGADVVTFYSDLEMQMLVKAGLVAPGWKREFPFDASPYTSVMVILVPEGNPKRIVGWDDLGREDVVAIAANPKTSGTGRFVFLTLWNWAVKQGGEDFAHRFVASVYQKMPVRASAARAATNVFVLQGMGDCLVTFENEALLVKKMLDKKGFQVVHASPTLMGEFPVAVLESTKKRGTFDAARAYLAWLYTPKGQEEAARHFLRPRDLEVLSRFRGIYPDIEASTPEKALGLSWATMQKRFFASGGLFDAIAEEGRRRP